MSMMPFRTSRRALLAAPLLAMPLGGGRAIAAEGDFNGFLAGLRRDALAQGIRSGTVDLAFRYIQFLPRVIELDQHQPDHKLTFAEFMNKVVTQQRLDDARRHLAENLPLLQRVQQRFNVQPRFIVALWGIESDFGKTQGSYSVPASLATLAYEGRRGALFRGELIVALKILDQGHIRPDNMLGSWAGAMGQCQFMPSTFLSYAVDFDGDGRRDIWNARADVLGSIANLIVVQRATLSGVAIGFWDYFRVGAGQFRHPPRRARQSPADRGMEPPRRAFDRRAVDRPRGGGSVAAAAGWAGRAGAADLR